MNRRSFLLQSTAATTFLMSGRLRLFAAESPVVETSAGKIQGLVEGKAFTFKGVPYGASTAGAGRFMARYIAKNVVAAGLAERAEIQLAYAIGVADPVSISVDTFGTGKIDQNKIADLIRENFQLTPRGIIESLDLRRPIYAKTASYGHFGRNEPEFTWEKTDKADTLKKQAGI